MTKEELEKEAEEYARKQWEGNLPWSVIQKSYYDGALPREQRIAELKDYAIQLKQAAVKRDEELTKQLLEFDKERTKAKEIIKELLDLDILPEIEIKKTAENFIKEEIAYVKYQ